MKRLGAFFAVVLLIACGGLDDPPPADYPCSNPLDPPGAFRMSYTADFVRVDTTPRTLNSYLEPHRSADTVRTVDAHGQTLLIVFYGAGGDPATRCVTMFDSLLHHLPNVIKAFEVP